MIRSAMKKARILSDENGATLVEFGLVAGPFILMLMGIMDLGYRGYVDTVSKSVLHKVARDALTISNSTAVRNQPFGAQVDLVETCVSTLD